MAPDSELAGETLISSNLRRRYGGTALAVQRGDRVTRDRIEDYTMREGDSLLLLVEREGLPVLEDEVGLVLGATSPADAMVAPAWEETEEERRRGTKAPVALGIVVAVVAVAALELMPIYVAALGGMVLMVVTGCLKTSQAYESVSWDIIFLLAGIIPLGIAMDKTGAARYLVDLVLARADALHPLVVLGVFYLLTAALTNVISNNASVVLMVPVAVDAAARVGADPFAFVLAVMFAASTAFMTPVGYQTNLIVYTPGGYRFTDYMRVGAPLQLLLAVVTPVGIAWIWGL